MRAITDPVSGRVIRREETHIGEIVVTEVEELSAVGNFTVRTCPKWATKSR